MRQSATHALTLLLYTLSGLIGFFAFTYPLLLPATPFATPTAQTTLAPWLTMCLLFLCLGVLLVEVQGQTVQAKVVAALGVLVAITAVLRFVEVALPGPGGFSPIFAPIILAGYIFGSRFGFLMGTMTLLTSALITGGVGPWLPYQMFAAGWVGLTAGWLPQWPQKRLEILLLAAFGFGWGLLFGLIMNLYTWPFLVGDVATTWQPNLSLRQIMGRYGAYYLLTSLIWDVARGLGNAILIAALGQPALHALRRFQMRFNFQREGIVP